MVSTIVRWIKDRLGISALERENVQLAKSLIAQRDRTDEALRQCGIAIQSAGDARALYLDHEARIAFCENSLTAKQTAAKIVPKAHKSTTRQFLEAASKATETEQGEA